MEQGYLYGVSSGECIVYNNSGIFLNEAQESVLSGRSDLVLRHMDYPILLHSRRE